MTAAERTGQELLAQVRFALNDGRGSSLAVALGALDGCVCLTAEEAETVRRLLQHEVCFSTDDENETCDECGALTLLSGGDKGEQ